MLTLTLGPHILSPLFPHQSYAPGSVEGPLVTCSGTTGGELGGGGLQQSDTEMAADSSRETKTATRRLTEIERERERERENAL